MKKKKRTKLQLKIKQINRANQKVRDYINKTREIQLIKYSTIIQKERKFKQSTSNKKRDYITFIIKSKKSEIFI